MFISVVFPVADLRSLHSQAAGRLEKPRWGEADPQAKFARGFGSIHTRTQSGNGFIGESYYADCNNAIRYPQQLFAESIVDSVEKILVYPVFRRFYFDGQLSGRFELGFRLNEATVYEIAQIKEVNRAGSTYDAVELVRQILRQIVVVKLLDGQILRAELGSISQSLRDAYLASSTKKQRYSQV